MMLGRPPPRMNGDGPVFVLAISRLFVAGLGIRVLSG